MDSSFTMTDMIMPAFVLKPRKFQAHEIVGAQVKVPVGLLIPLLSRVAVLTANSNNSTFPVM